MTRPRMSSIELEARREPHSRDVAATAFTAILDDLVSRLPGAYAAALVDGEGETVDYAGDAPAFDVRIAAAHVQILLAQVEAYGVLGSPRWVIVGGAKKSVVAQRLPEGYGLAVLLRERAAFRASRRAFAACERALAREAGWPPSAARAWYSVDVEVDRRGRPKCVAKKAGGDVEVDVLGAVVGLPRRERGFRVRTADGHELTLVREGRRCWYADEDLTSSVSSPKRR